MKKVVILIALSLWSVIPAFGKDKLMCDPGICHSPDGTFRMACTSSWTDRIIGYASSRNLIHCAVEALKRKSWFNDKDLILTGVYYYPEHWDESQWERDFKKMHELGFEFTHFAEFAWAQLEPEEGRYDFAWLDRAVALAAKYDLKVIMCTSTATPPVWMSRKYPEILLKNENGTILDHGARQHASFASPLYRELSYKMIEKLAQHYGNDSRIVGWQLDNEPAVQFDYNPKAELAFRDFSVPNTIMISNY